MTRTKSMIYKPTQEATELYLFATNDGDLYRQSITPAIENLKRKVAKGIYDQNKSIDLFYHIATAASNKYQKYYGYSFSVGDRWTAAVDMAEHYKEEIFYNED